MCLGQASNVGKGISSIKENVSWASWGKHLMWVKGYQVLRRMCLGLAGVSI